MAATKLNCERWEKRDDNGEHDVDVANARVAELYEHFKEPLWKAGLNGSLGELLDQWHHLIEYTKQYLEPSKTQYLRFGLETIAHFLYCHVRNREWNRLIIMTFCFI